MMIVWIILGVIVLAILWLAYTFNSLVRGKNQVDESWSDISVQLKRRYDLIPNLVETVKGYATHESELFIKVTQARTAAMSAQAMTDKTKAENQLSAVLKSIMAVSENYPELKASQNFLALQDELADTENKIQAARRFYNSNVMHYNIQLQSFPTNLIGQAFNFTGRQYFELDEEAAKQPVKVQF